MTPSLVTQPDAWAPLAVINAPTTAPSGVVAILSETDVVTARQQGRTLAARLGFSLTEATLVATAISELARNILLYAGSGTIVLQTIDDCPRRGILIVAADNGPGIADVRQALAGGYSTSGGLGLGLCGVRGLVDDFDIVSKVGAGTTVTLKKWIH
jgi:serine/threonine-protein kinase RsbT